MAGMGSCPCQGLILMRDIVDVLDLFTSSRNPDFSDTEVQHKVRQARQKAATVGRRIQIHLHQALEQAGEDQRALVAEDLDYIREQNNLLQNADEPMLYFDNIRDRIHKQDNLKQLMVCGSGKELVTEASIIKDAAVMAGGDEVEEAGAMLDEVIKVLCTS
jgi:hypothetical protein